MVLAKGDYLGRHPPRHPLMAMPSTDGGNRILAAIKRCWLDHPAQSSTHISLQDIVKCRQVDHTARIPRHGYKVGFARTRRRRWTGYHGFGTRKAGEGGRNSTAVESSTTWSNKPTGKSNRGDPSFEDCQNAVMQETRHRRQRRNPISAKDVLQASPQPVLLRPLPMHGKKKQSSIHPTIESEQSVGTEHERACMLSPSSAPSKLKYPTQTMTTNEHSAS